MRKLFITLLVSGLALMNFQTSYAQKKGDKASFLISVKTPVRPVGQESALRLTAPKLNTVRVGFIGLGMRGPGAVERFIHIPGIKVVALCDIRPESVEMSQSILKKAGLPEAASYSGSENVWKQLCELDDIDLIYIATDWKRHAEMAIYAMEHGKHVAISRCRPQ